MVNVGRYTIYMILSETNEIRPKTTFYFKVFRRPWKPFVKAFPYLMGGFITVFFALRIQICPKKGISPIFLFWGWDWNPQSYSREGSGFLGLWIFHRRSLKVHCMIFGLVTTWPPP